MTRSTNCSPLLPNFFVTLAGIAWKGDKTAASTSIHKRINTTTQ